MRRGGEGEWEGKAEGEGKEIQLSKEQDLQNRSNKHDRSPGSAANNTACGTARRACELLSFMQPFYHLCVSLQKAREMEREREWERERERRRSSCGRWPATCPTRLPATPRGPLPCQQAERVRRMRGHRGEEKWEGDGRGTPGKQQERGGEQATLTRWMHTRMTDGINRAKTANWMNDYLWRHSTGKPRLPTL